MSSPPEGLPHTQRYTSENEVMSGKSKQKLVNTGSCGAKELISCIKQGFLQYLSVTAADTESMPRNSILQEKSKRETDFNSE